MIKSTESYLENTRRMRGRLVFSFNHFLAMPDSYKEFGVRHGRDIETMESICVELFRDLDAGCSVEEWRRHVVNFYLAPDLLDMLDHWVQCGRNDVLAKLSWTGE